MNWLSFFVRRPIATAMLLSIFLFFGIIGFLKLPVDLFPNISHPQLSVAIHYENASAEEIERLVTKPLEEELSFLKNLTYMSSTSEEGFSRIQLHFQWGTGMDFAALEAREKIDIAKAKLPEGADDPLIERHNPNARPILVLNLMESKSDEDFRRIADVKMKPALERILGVAQVKVMGGFEREIEVKLHPHQLKSLGISIQQVIDALKHENVTSRGGMLREGKVDLLIKVTGELKTEEDIGNTIIVKKNQVPVYLKNLGEVKTVPKKQKNRAFLNGKLTIAIELYKEPTGNTLSIIKNAKKLIPVLEAESNVKLLITYNQADVINASLSMLKSNAFQGALLTALTLFFFLKNIASTLVICLSIPFSTICSFFFLYLCGVSINIFSIAGIALALGIVVDASIVILENIFVHIQNQEHPKRAAVHGTLEVSGAVTASALTTIAVFIPILFLKGPIGLIFRDLSLTIIFGLLFSMLVSYLFIPVVSAQSFRLQRPQEKFSKKIDRWKTIVGQGLKILDQVYHLGTKISLLYERILERFTLSPEELYEKAIQKTETGSQKMEEIEHKMETQYERSLKEAIRSWKARVSIIFVMFAIFILSLLFIPKTEFFPQSLQTHYEINIKFPEATSLAYTEERCKKIETFLKTLPDIKSQHLHLKPADGTFIIEFSNIKRAPKRLSTIRHHLEQAPDIYFNVIALTPLSAIVEGIETRAIDFKVKGPDLKNLTQIATRFAGLLKELRGVISVSQPEKEGKPEMNIVIDREKAADLALTSKAIADNLKHQLYGTEATDISIDGEEIPVTIRSQTAAIDTHHDLYNLLIPSPLGPHVPLETLAEFKETFVPTTLPREEKERTLTVTAILDPGTSPQEIIQRVGSKQQGLTQTLNLTEDYSIQVGPQIKTLEKSLWDLKIAIFAAILLIYLILAAQFESLIHPFTILFSVPLCLIGIVVSLRLTGQFLSLPAMIGIIILVGTSVSNAIILIDYINILRRRGIDREEAILEAGRRRLRPILMTAITTVTGILPMAFGFGSGTELYQPLAIVIVGGLISSTPLTLLFIPTIYCFFDDLGDILGLSLLKFQMKFLKK